MTIIAVTGDVATCRMLRRVVFIEEQGVSEADEVDDRDGDAVHLLAWVADRPVGSARLLRDGAMGKVGRVCVLADQRGKGLGAALIRAAGRADWWFGYQAVSQLSALPLIWGLMTWGLDAVMWALTLRVLLLWPFSVSMTLRLIDLSLLDYIRAVAAPFSAAALMAGVIVNLSPLLEGAPPALRLGLEIGIGAAVYLAAVIPFSWDRLSRLRTILRNRKATS